MSTMHKHIYPGREASKRNPSMTASAHDNPATLDLTHEQAWVLHTGILRYLERMAAHDDPAPEAVSLLHTLERETDPALDADALRLVQTVLVEYMADAPVRDRAACRSVLSDVRRVTN